MSDPSDSPPHGGLISPEEVVAACPGARGVVVVGACDAELPLAFRRLLPRARVLALEGLRENYDRWLYPVPDLEADCVVVGARCERREFYIQAQNGLHSLYDRGKLVDKRVVRTETLDSVVDGYRIISDIVTIDVEGAAWDVIFGGGAVMERASVVMVETEGHEFFRGQHLRPDVHALLLGHGFKLSLERSVEILDGQVQYEELWVADREERC